MAQSVEFPVSPAAYDPAHVGQLDAYLTRLELTWVNLAEGLAGTTAPRLAGDGDLSPLSPVGVKLVAALPLASATLVAGFTRIDAPFKGGVLVPQTDLLLGPIVTSVAGTFGLSGNRPGGLPPGLQRLPAGLAGRRGRTGRLAGEQRALGDHAMTVRSGARGRRPTDSPPCGAGVGRRGGAAPARVGLAP